MTFFCALSLLFGCGPQMRTTYHFVPPETPEGRACIYQCENIQLQCDQLDQSEYSRCLDRAEDDYRRCEDRNVYRRQDDQEYCYRSYCPSPDGERCKERHRSCYQSCGGQVSSETVCVANCDKM
ncbi:MAG: hypothetical protein KDD64_10220 [Bdellovibrionales bacterium]|nr:hypothetical protein [Bdellovibrionales bacterium]